MIDAFNITSRYLNDLLNIDNIHFEQMVHRIYPTELQLNEANASDTETALSDLNLSIHNDTVSTKIYDKRDDFAFDIVNVPFIDGDVLGIPLMVFIYLNLFTLPGHLRMLMTSIIVTINDKLLVQSYRYHILQKHFPNCIVGTLI